MIHNEPLAVCGDEERTGESPSGASNPTVSKSDQDHRNISFLSPNLLNFPNFQVFFQVLLIFGNLQSSFQFVQILSTSSNVTPSCSCSSSKLHDP